MKFARAPAWLAFAAGSFQGIPIPASAQDRAVELCTTVKTHPQGGYTFEPRPDLDVRVLTSRPGPFRLARSENVVGITCVRESLIPQALDMEVLQAGYTFAIGDIESEATNVIQLELRESRVRWETLTGTVSKRQRALIDDAVARMNAVLSGRR